MPAPLWFFNRVPLEMARFEPSRRPVLMQDRTLCRSVQLGFGAGTVSSNVIGILNMAFFRVPTLRIPVADRVRSRRTRVCAYMEEREPAFPEAGSNGRNRELP